MNKYSKAFDYACMMLQEFEGLEIRSALKQAASDVGIKEGTEMGVFVRWAEEKLFGETYYGS